MSKLLVLKPTDAHQGSLGNCYKIFLGGSIDQGKAVDWQSAIETALADEEDVVIYNPRRDNWDPNMVQDISNPDFVHQVEWELDRQENSDLIVYYFDPNGLAPITLMELGAYGKDNGFAHVLVCCPEGYWRRGNVQIFCRKYGIAMVDDLDTLIQAIRDLL